MSFDPIAHAYERSRVQGQIQQCTRCPLSEMVKRPVSFRGRTPNDKMIVGEAPGWQENIQGRPFVGESGQLLARMMHEAGLPAIEEWFVANTVSCYPKGTPEPESQRACRNNLRAQIRLADPSWVLLLGNVALQSTEWCGEKIGAIHGRPFQCDGGPYIGRWVFPTFHPAAGLRDDKRMNEIRVDLSTLRDVMSEKLPLSAIAVRIGRKGKVRT